jgi:hypothetical protein
MRWLQILALVMFGIAVTLSRDVLIHNLAELFVVLFASSTVIKRFLSRRSGAVLGRKVIGRYEALLRAIDKSQPNTGARSAASTAIDSVARRAEGSRLAASLVLMAALLLMLLLTVRYGYEAPLPLRIFLVGAIAVLWVSKLALDYRISRGLFGTNEYEAREIVRFVLRNASDTDLSGGLGARKLDLTPSTETELAAVWNGVPVYE